MALVKNPVKVTVYVTEDQLRSIDADVHTFADSRAGALRRAWEAYSRQKARADVTPDDLFKDAG